MNKFVAFSMLLLSFFTFTLCAQDSVNEDSLLLDSINAYYDAFEKSLTYESGTVNLEAGNAKVNVPPGFKFLPAEQAQEVLTAWGNPENNTVLGLLMPEMMGVFDDNSWVFVVTYDEMGYVSDEDAEDVDYDELLLEQQEGIRAANPSRVAEGYESLDLIGWASAPYYDKDKKVLHWAKEIKFGDSPINTLNYNLRVLGRKGVFMINAVADMNALPEVKNNIDKVISCVEFKQGSRYADFDPDIDEVAAWTVGGLVAGKILAKGGFFVILAKFGKFIFIAIAGAFAAFMKFIKRK